ncbi:hypothetical protein FOJ82_11580 [Tessaracoccus rhinocerotis]|uniref:Uncharacterized protein n=1 Tax=Tessaracoccus rhinocerotis TaxID=1689449 RepID=A0A553JZK5_9ACTN|nr:hypothetical protein [Tessaracoccus rhinocerotis]TRY17898.1 hypothetical protein FOJ82_11580 [Tessaracoccus rhinocerotis]
MKRLLLPLTILPFLALAGCSGASGTPCEGEFAFSNGSMPPPFSHRWTVTFTDGAGSIVWTSPYASPQPEWSAEFEPTDDAVVALCDAIRDAPTESDSVGGPVASWETNSGSGSTDTGVNELAAAARELVGAETFDQLRKQYEGWQAEQDEG